MIARDPWLQNLERQIDLPSYLGQRGYQPDPRSPASNGIVMTHPSSGDVVVVRKRPDADVWSYSNPSVPGDQGTVCDFMMRRDRLTLAGAAERLIAFSAPITRDVEARRYRDAIQNPPAELQKIKVEHLRVVEAERGATGTLEKLGIPKGTLDEWRFGEVKTRDAVIRMITDPPDLWASRYRPSDKKLVFAEQPIDAIAYEKSHGKQAACYMATGKQLTEGVKRKIAHVLCEVPPGVTVVLAFGRDERGRQLAEQVRALAPTVKMARQEPDFGNRWSTQMQLEQRHSRSIGRRGPELSR